MSETNDSINVMPVDISYEPTRARSHSKIVISAIVLFAGISFVVIGGCFLIGVLILRDGAFGSIPSNPDPLLLVILYGLAFASFGAAVWLIVIGLRGLFDLK